MPAINFKTIEENLCALRAMEQWKASLNRPDLTEEDRVIGAIEAYQRQAFTLSSDFMPKAVYRHKKRGTKYEIMGFGKLQATDLSALEYNDAWQTFTYKPVDMIDVVVYRDIINEQEIWVRPKSEFFDGRFEEINK